MAKEKKSLLKRIKKFFKRIKEWIMYKINPKSLKKKKRKKFEERESSRKYSFWGEFCRLVTGTRNLKVQPA
jgi:hypothetical protein